MTSFDRYAPCGEDVAIGKPGYSTKAENERAYLTSRKLFDRRPSIGPRPKEIQSCLQGDQITISSPSVSPPPEQRAQDKSVLVSLKIKRVPNSFQRQMDSLHKYVPNQEKAAYRLGYEGDDFFDEFIRHKIETLSQTPKFSLTPSSSRRPRLASYSINRPGSFNC